MKGRASCRETLLQLFTTVLPKVRSALCAASLLPGEGLTDVEDAPAPACLPNYDDDDDDDDDDDVDDDDDDDDDEIKNFFLNFYQF